MSRVVARKPFLETDGEPNPDIIDGVEYPSSDGKPMAETEIHFQTIVLLYQILHHHYCKDPTVHVVGNIMLYWERGNPKACGSPDVMVSFGVFGTHPRRSFICWKEGVVPSVAFEIASRKTWRARIGRTKNDYERAGIKEYFVFDPERRFIPEGLLGFRLKGKRYARIAPKRDGSMWSREMNLLLIPHGYDLRVAHPETGDWLLTEAEEQQHKADEERRRADEEHRRADSLQEEVNRLRSLLERRNGKGNGTRKS